MKDVRMLPGAPPDDQLTVRITTTRSYVPNPENYVDRSETQYKDEGGGTLTDGTRLGMMLYDKANIDNHEFGIDEIFPDDAPEIHKWELVDDDGKVWTEEFEVEDSVKLDEETRLDLGDLLKDD